VTDLIRDLWLQVLDHPPTAECPDPECMVCAMRDCPDHEPLHYHHDGCPCCSYRSLPEQNSTNDWWHLPGAIPPQP
jgi:hypothetical protein